MPRPPVPTDPGSRADRTDLVPAGRQRTDSFDLSVGNNLNAELLSQVEIIVVKGVLGVPATAGHAFTTFTTAGTGGPDTTEVGIRDLDPGLLAAGPAEKNAHIRQAERMADAHFLGNRPIYLVGMGDRRV